MPRRPCTKCGTQTSVNINSRVRTNGPSAVLCVACRHHLPEALARYDAAEPPGEIARAMSIPPEVLLPYLRAQGRDLRCARCQTPLNRPGASLSEHARLDPVTGVLGCGRCVPQMRHPCALCGRVRTTKSGRLVALDGARRFLCGWCYRRRIVPRVCAEPGCGAMFPKGWPHPEDPTRRLCRRCWQRAYVRRQPPFECAECRTTFPPGTRSAPHPVTRTRRVCLRCLYRVRRRVAPRGRCPRCRRVTRLAAHAPRRPAERWCLWCDAHAKAPRHIARWARQADTWPAAHQAFFHALLPAGPSRAGDVALIGAFVRGRRLLPPDLDLSPAGLAALRAFVLGTPRLPRSDRVRFAEACRRALRRLHGPRSALERLCERLKHAKPLPWPEVNPLLLAFAAQELPRLGYAPRTIEDDVRALLRFFRWVAQHCPDVRHLHDLTPTHVVRYRRDCHLPTSRPIPLAHAWSVFAPFATSHGALAPTRLIIDAAPKGPRRSTPIYRDPLALFAAFDRVACDSAQDPFVRMYAHLLTLAARNTFAVLVARKRPRPAYIAALSGRSEMFGARLLGSRTLDPDFGRTALRLVFPEGSDGKSPTHS